MVLTPFDYIAIFQSGAVLVISLFMVAYFLTNLPKFAEKDLISLMSLFIILVSFSSFKDIVRIAYGQISSVEAMGVLVNLFTITLVTYVFFHFKNLEEGQRVDLKSNRLVKIRK